MEELINQQLNLWNDIRNQWYQNFGNAETYLNLPVIPFQGLQNGSYHNSHLYDILLPPLQILGNTNENIENKILIISLEPLKTDRDLNRQYNYFFETPFGYQIDFETYGLHPLNEENYHAYQNNYFDVFPEIIDNPSPHSQGSNIYWRYIDCFANGYQRNIDLKSNDWLTLRNTIVDMPISPLWARRHPGFSVNNAHLIDLFIEKIQILRPRKILVLGSSKKETVMNLLELTENLNFLETFVNGNFEASVYSKDFEWGECKVIFRRFFSNGGGTYVDAFNLGSYVSIL